MGQSRSSELRLLVVEDEALIAIELEDILADLGHNVLEVCASVSRAVAFIQEKADELDGAIIDANLGGTSAVPVAEALDKHHVPFFVASGYTEDEVRRLGCLAARIHKPYRPEEIELALESMACRR
jgi:DNA-binding response OmpR family regulator